ncbi:MAG: 16S rRNA methyltransferase [Methanobacteriota archaeon]|nr:MAG: 16S rRNA methyltransferase [Euryarchaeota archaeon]
MLDLILADTELELVPEELASHPSIVKNAKKRGKSPSKILLDISLHRSAFGDSPEVERRGRPDIPYIVLALCLDSIANAERKLTTLIHTRNDELIEISPRLRLPKRYNRFVGLMEDLFEKGAVPEGKPLLTITRNMTLEKVIEKCSPETTICLSPDGEPGDLIPLFNEVKKPFTCIIGGFPEGDYTSPAKELSDRVVSISPHLLKVWTVASNILVSYEQSEKTYK